MRSMSVAVVSVSVIGVLPLACACTIVAYRGIGQRTGAMQDPASELPRTLNKAEVQRRRTPLLGTSVNKPALRAYVPFHSTVSSTFCALAVNSLKPLGDVSSIMVTV